MENDTAALDLMIGLLSLWSASFKSEYRFLKGLGRLSKTGFIESQY